MKYKQIVQHDVHSFSSTPHASKEESYVLVDKRFFHINDTVNFNLYYRDSASHMTLFLQRKSVIHKSEEVKIHKTKSIYTTLAEKKRYDLFRNTHLDEIVQDNTLSLDEKTEIIYESTVEISDTIFANPMATNNIALSEEVINPILKSIFYSKDAISSYMKIIEYDYYTHTHSLNVSIYALCIGVALKLERSLLKDLGQAALLHDLGKSQIAHDIIDKDGTLTDLEYKNVKLHPVLGYEIALELGIKEKNILDGILHHHEQLNGSGYPDGLKGEQISLFPKIIAVCDVFDALTARRTYKNAMSSYEALYIMKTQMKRHLDIDILNSFIETLHE